MPDVNRFVLAPSDDSTEAILKMMLAFSYASECCEIGLAVKASFLRWVRSRARQTITPFVGCLAAPTHQGKGTRSSGKRSSSISSMWNHLYSRSLPVTSLPAPRTASWRARLSELS